MLAQVASRDEYDCYHAPRRARELFGEYTPPLSERQKAALQESALAEYPKPFLSAAAECRTRGVQVDNDWDRLPGIEPCEVRNGKAFYHAHQIDAFLAFKGSYENLTPYAQWAHDRGHDWKTWQKLLFEGPVTPEVERCFDECDAYFDDGEVAE